MRETEGVGEEIVKIALGLGGEKEELNKNNNGDNSNNDLSNVQMLVLYDIEQ